MGISSERLEVLVLPVRSRNAVARALGGIEWQLSSLVVVALKERPPHVVALRFYDEAGQAADLDLAPIAAKLSASGWAVGLASIDPVAHERRWECWQGGERGEVIGIDDETWVPRDDEGFPDLDAEPVRFGDGVPAEGWRRLRTCLDLGMERQFSCRFVPIARAFDRLRTGGEVNARAFVLVSDGAPVRPPAEVRWPPARRVGTAPKQP